MITQKNGSNFVCFIFNQDKMSVKVIRVFYEGSHPTIWYTDRLGIIRAAILNHDGHCPLSCRQIDQLLAQLISYERSVDNIQPTLIVG